MAIKISVTKFQGKEKSKRKQKVLHSLKNKQKIIQIFGGKE